MKENEDGGWVRFQDAHKLKQQLAESQSHNKMLVEALDDAFVSGYYDGAGDYAWYKDHDDNGELKDKAYVHIPLKEYKEQAISSPPIKSFIAEQEAKERLIIKVIKLMITPWLHNSDVEAAVREEISSLLQIQEQNKGEG